MASLSNNMLNLVQCGKDLVVSVYFVFFLSGAILLYYVYRLITIVFMHACTPNMSACDDGCPVCSALLEPLADKKNRKNVRQMRVSVIYFNCVEGQRLRSDCITGDAEVSPDEANTL